MDTQVLPNGLPGVPIAQGPHSLGGGDAQSREHGRAGTFGEAQKKGEYVLPCLGTYA